MLSRPVVDLARRLAATLPEPLDEGPAAVHRRRVERGRAPDGQARHRPVRGRVLRPVLARHDPGRGERHLQLRPAGYGPARPRQPRHAHAECLPVPDFLTRRRRAATGGASSTSASTSIDAQSVGQPRRVHRRADPELGRPASSLPLGYLAALQRKCRERGMLLILDEAQTGLCRPAPGTRSSATASSPTSSRCPRRSGAGCPLAAVVTSARDRGDGATHARLPFFTTHVSDPLVAAVGNTVLDVLERDEPGRARRGDSGAAPADGAARARRPAIAVIGDVRGRGLMQGIELRDRPARGAGLGRARRGRHPALPGARACT